MQERLLIYANIAAGLVVYPHVIEKHLREELPFMATEEILMAGVRAGGDRQQLHELIRRHSQAAATRVKERGLPNDLLDRLSGDAAFANVDLSEAMEPSRFIGRAPQQVDDFIMHVVQPIRDRYSDALREADEDLKV